MTPPPDIKAGLLARVRHMLPQCSAESVAQALHTTAAFCAAEEDAADRALIFAIGHAQLLRMIKRTPGNAGAAVRERPMTSGVTASHTARDHVAGACRGARERHIRARRGGARAR